MKNPCVYDYRDFRKFLLDVYLAKKQESPKFSYMYFARKAGIAKGHLQRIVNGSRNVAESKLEAIGRALRLEGPELDYFILLAVANQTAVSVARTMLEKGLEFMRAAALGSGSEDTEESNDSLKVHSVISNGSH